MTSSTSCSADAWAAVVEVRRYVVAFGALGRLVVELLPSSWVSAIKGTGPVWPLSDGTDRDPPDVMRPGRR